MSPPLPFHDVAYKSLRNVKPFSDCSIGQRGSHCSHGNDVGFGQLRLSTPTSSWRSVWMCARAVANACGASSLRFGLAVILSTGASVEVVRSYARRIVATVANEYQRPLACIKHVGNTVRPASSWVQTKRAISLFVSEAFPRPAGALWPLAGSFIDLAPKTLDVLFRKLGRGRIDFSHLDLRDRLIWLGSAGVSRTRSSRLYFSTAQHG